MVPVASPFIRPHTVPPGKTRQHQPPPAQRSPPPGPPPPLGPPQPHHFYTHSPPYPPPPPLPPPHPMYGHPTPYHAYPPYRYPHPPPPPPYPHYLPPLPQPPTLIFSSPSAPSFSIIPYTLESDLEKTPLGKSACEPLSPPLTPLPAEAHHRYNHELPTPLRALIIHSLQSGTPQREIALIYNLPHSTVSRTIKRYNETGSLRSSQRNGAPRRLEERVIDELVEVIRGDPRIGIKELLGRTRVRVCRGTLVARLKERNGLRRDHRKGIWMEKYGNIVRKKKEGWVQTEAEVEVEVEVEAEAEREAESEGGSGDERDESLEGSTEPVIVNESDSRSGSKTPSRTSPAPPVETLPTVRHISQPPCEPTSSHISVPTPPYRLRSEPPSLQDLMNPPEAKESSGGNGTVTFGLKVGLNGRGKDGQAVVADDYAQDRVLVQVGKRNINIWGSSK